MSLGVVDQGNTGGSTEQQTSWSAASRAVKSMQQLAAQAPVFSSTIIACPDRALPQASGLPACSGFAKPQPWALPAPAPSLRQDCQRRVGWAPVAGTRQCQSSCLSCHPCPQSLPAAQAGPWGPPAAAAMQAQQRRSRPQPARPAAPAGCRGCGFLSAQPSLWRPPVACRAHTQGSLL